MSSPQSGISPAGGSAFPPDHRARVGLALGAGGVLGGAWMASALAALERATGWPFGRAERILGTSAGALFAALVACGLPAERMLPVAEGAREELPDPPAADFLLARLASAASYRYPWWRTRPVPGSLGLAGRGLRTGAPFQTLCGLLPAGLVSTEPIQETVRAVAPTGWAPHPGCWLVASDYATGARTVFGGPSAPRTSLDRAVAASCAIPGFFRPVTIRGRRYVDGGLRSPSNLDLLSGQDLDLVIVLSPMSAAPRTVPGGIPGRLTTLLRRRAAACLKAEVATLRAQGTEVLLIEPAAEALAAMGPNMMDARHSRRVAFATWQALTVRLRQPELRRRLAALGAADRSADGWRQSTAS